MAEMTGDDQANIVKDTGSGAAAGSVAGPWGTVIGAGVGLAVGLMQWQGSDAARKASQKERDRINDLINKLQDPKFDTSLILPEEYAVVEKYVPQYANYVAELAPQTVKAASEGAVKGRAAQMAALDRMRNLSVTGEDTQSRILTQQALDASAAQNSGQSQLIDQQMQRRGMGGSGMDLVAQLMNQQKSNQSAQTGAQNQALSAYQNRLQALRDSAAMGSDIRGQDVALESQNAGIINAFNARQAQRLQDYGNRNTDIANNAAMYNANVAQTEADKSTAARNAAYVAQHNDINQAYTNVYNAALNKVKLQTGQGGENISSIRQDAQDKNQAIAGVGKGITSGIGAYQQYAATQPKTGSNTDTTQLDDESNKWSKYANS